MGPTIQTAQDLQEWLELLLQESDLNEELGQDAEGQPVVRDVTSFAEAGVMTRNKGLVVQLANGRRAHLTIVME